MGDGDEKVPSHRPIHCGHRLDECAYRFGVRLEAPELAGQPEAQEAGGPKRLHQGLRHSPFVLLSIAVRCHQRG